MAKEHLENKYFYSLQPFSLCEYCLHNAYSIHKHIRIFNQKTKKKKKVSTQTLNIIKPFKSNVCPYLLGPIPTKGN